MTYSGVLPNSKERPTFQIYTLPKLQALWHILLLSLGNLTWLSLGATMQTCLVLLPLPRVYALMPGVLYLATRILLTCLITFGVIPNPYMKGVIPFRTTAIVPDEQGKFPSPDELPTKQKIAILILNAKINHPAGMLAAPHMFRFAELFEKMIDALYEQPQSESGCLGHSEAYMPAPDGTVEILNISYWRSKEHILQFADGPIHRDAIKWFRDLGAYDGKGGKAAHIGLGHEIYESEAGHWETTYIGCQPTLLGATSFLKKGRATENGSVPDEWVSPILDARRGKLAGARGRMGLPTGSKQQVMVEM